MKKTVICLFALITIVMTSCSEDDSLEQEEIETGGGGTATESHPNDGSVDNGDGTTTNTLGDFEFTTVHKDYSSEPKVTEDQVLVSGLDVSYKYANEIEGFRVFGSNLFTREAASAFDNSARSYLFPANYQVSSIKPSSGTYYSGFDYNGAVLVVDGSENLNFYSVVDGGISDLFFSYENFKGSKFLSSCFLDENKVYVYDTDKIWSFEFGDISHVQTVTSIPNFSSVAFDADEDHIYVSVGNHGASSVKIIDKVHHDLAHKLDLAGKYVRGVAVDANYIYVSDADSQKVFVYNKHTYNEIGTIDTTNPRSLQKVDDYLYVANFDNKTIEKYLITFN